jgi:dihydroneopterin aldolase
MPAADAARGAAEVAAVAACSAGCSVDACLHLSPNATLRSSPTMTRFLASVRDEAEAEAALASGADIIDLKDPARGALGALTPEGIASCVTAIAGRAELSATVGDLPMVPDTIRSAVLATAATGVDYVKLGLFPGGDPCGCLSLLAEEVPGLRLILVVFADAPPSFDAIAAASRIGASGVMLDTARKDGSSLLDHLTLDRLGNFVAAAHAEGLLAGLAGSLKAIHVPELLRLKPDLLGFRGALCRNGARGAALDTSACAAIRALIPGAPRAAAMAAMPELSPSLC